MNPSVTEPLYSLAEPRLDPQVSPIARYRSEDKLRPVQALRNGPMQAYEDDGVPALSSRQLHLLVAPTKIARTWESVQVNATQYDGRHAELCASQQPGRPDLRRRAHVAWVVLPRDGGELGDVTGFRQPRVGTRCPECGAVVVETLP
jgi:hypothetical protein